MLRYLEIKDMLRTMIEAMQPGEKLPSRPSLINKLETTRTTLDKALLAAEVTQRGSISGATWRAVKSEASQGFVKERAGELEMMVNQPSQH